MGPGLDWVRLVTASAGADAALAGVGFGASLLYFLRGLADFVPAPDRCREWNRAWINCLRPAPGGADAPWRRAGFGASFFVCLREFGFDFVPAPDRAESGGPGSDWVRSVICAGRRGCCLCGSGVRCCFIFVCLPGLALICACSGLCREWGFVPDVCLVTASGGAMLLRPERGSVLHFCIFATIGFDFVPAPDRSESGAGSGMGSPCSCVGRRRRCFGGSGARCFIFVFLRRLDSILCLCGHDSFRAFQRKRLRRMSSWL